MSTNFTTFIFLVFVSLLPSRNLHAADFTHFENWIFDHRLRNTHAIIAMKDGEIIFEKYEKGFTSKSQMRLHSLSKLFLSAFYGHYALQKKISPSTSLNKIFKQVPENWSPNLKVYHLLEMSSGLNYFTDYGNYFGFGIINPTRADDKKYNFLNIGLSNAFQAIEPGEMFNYSNIDQALLLEIINVLSPESSGNKDFKIFLRALGLLDTRINTNKTVEQISEINKIISSVIPSSTLEAYTIRNSLQAWSSARDLAKLAQVFLDNYHGKKTALANGWSHYSWKVSGRSLEAVKEDYGALWYINKKAQGAMFKKLPEDTVLIKGLHGQTVAIFPKKNLIFIRLSSDARYLVDREEMLLRFLNSFNK